MQAAFAAQAEEARLPDVHAGLERLCGMHVADRHIALAGEGVLRLMKKINESEGTTFIFSTHDFRVMEMADRVVNISDGRLAGTGKEETGHG